MLHKKIKITCSFKLWENTSILVSYLLLFYYACIYDIFYVYKCMVGFLFFGPYVISLDILRGVGDQGKMFWLSYCLFGISPQRFVDHSLPSCGSGNEYLPPDSSYYLMTLTSEHHRNLQERVQTISSRPLVINSNYTGGSSRQCL